MEYGSPECNFGLIAKLWSLYTENKPIKTDPHDPLFSAHDVAMWMPLATLHWQAIRLGSDMWGELMELAAMSAVMTAGTLALCGIFSFFFGDRNGNGGGLV